LNKPSQNPPKIGTCAWSFEDWRGVFYPPQLPSNQWLAWYSRFFSAVEIDSTFYATPSRHTIAQWLRATPDDFVFTCKMPREITHARKLRHSRELLRQFLEGIAPLRPKLGMVLIQLPPFFEPQHDLVALKEFIFDLPTNDKNAVPFAVEFRHPGWHQPSIVQLFENMGICWVWNDTSALKQQNRAPFAFLPRTTGSLYIRLLGDLSTKKETHRYVGLTWPRNAALESWAAKIKKHLSTSQRVFVFANNHYEGFSPMTCQRLAEQLGVKINLPPQSTFFASAHAKAAATDDAQLQLF